VPATADDDQRSILRLLREHRRQMALHYQSGDFDAGI
jgi:hypothetical protein